MFPPTSLVSLSAVRGRGRAPLAAAVALLGALLLIRGHVAETTAGKHAIKVVADAAEPIDRPVDAYG